MEWKVSDMPSADETAMHAAMGTLAYWACRACRLQEPAVNAEIVLQLVPQQGAGEDVICFGKMNEAHKR